MGQGFEFFQYLYLALEQYFVDVVFQEAEIDDFDGNIVACVVVATTINVAGVSFADDVVETVGVAFDFLAGEGVAHFSLGLLR